MNYIVFDLEWNQNPNERMKPNKLLPFEIIEIGAVKLDENRQVIDTFHRLIKPSVYHWIQDSIHQVIHVNYRDLLHGDPFPDAAGDFLAWCGSDFRFCTWAKQDVMELQRNMRYYHMLDLLPGPVVYYDVQKLYSLSYEDGRQRRSLEHVTDALAINKDKSFHRAFADAWYTGQILARIEDSYLSGYESLDSYQNPKGKADFTYFSGEREQYLSREYTSRERVLADPKVLDIYCPICKAATFREEVKWDDKGASGLPVPTRAQKPVWAVSNARVCYSLSYCPVHGSVAGRIRVRRTEEDRYFAVKNLRLVKEQEAKELRHKLNLLGDRKKKNNNLRFP